MQGDPPAFLQPQFVMIIAMIGFMYLAVFRPQMKQRKEHENMLKALDRNDEVITAGGVHATVVAVGEKTATLRIADNVKIEIEKSSITTVTKSRSGVAEKAVQVK